MATSQFEKNNKKCCLCFEDNKLQDAEKYCVQCKNYYCTPCSAMHRKLPLMKGHELLDKTDFWSLDLFESVPGIPTQRCSEHKTEVINFYCKDHDEVACHSCINLAHRACLIMLLPDKVDDNLYNRTQLTETKEQIRKAITSMQEIKAAKQHQIRELKQVFDKEVQRVQSFRQELQSLLEMLEQNTIKELQLELYKIESNLQQEISEINKLTGAITQESSQLISFEGNKALEFVAIKTLKKLAVQAKSVESEQKRKAGVTASFIARQSFKPFLQQHQSLGKVLVDIHTLKEHTYTVKQGQEISVKMSNDISNCNICCSCITEDGYLLMTDDTNKRLKLLDMSTETIKDYVDLQYEPNALCLINKTEIAVALNNKIQFVSMGNKLHATRTLTLNHYCYGLGHMDGRLFISDSNKAVYIHDMNGKQLKAISIDDSGKEIFQQSRHIAFSAEGDRVFVTDIYKGLIILDHQGKYLTTLKLPTLTNAMGVCTGGKYIYMSVAGYPAILSCWDRITNC